VSAVQFIVRGPQEVIFGCGVIAQLPERAAAVGKRPMLVVGGKALRASGRLAGILSALEAAGLTVALFDGVEHDPSVETVDRGRAAFAQGRCDSIAAVGGGSVLDVAKAIEIGRAHV
jgi:alcohol dehydrogenase class IV